MKLYRYCGQEEINKLMNGETIENNTDWSEDYDTNSKGFCFFAYNRTNNIMKVISKSLEDWLEGIVDAHYLVEIEVETARKAKGFYASGYHTEYNLTTYSINDIKAIYKVTKLAVKDWIQDRDEFLTYGAEQIL